MDIKQLKYFLCVSRTCSFTKASEELFISRQAVGLTVRQLESELNAPLLEKDKNTIRLTPLGEVFAEEAEKVVAHFDAFERAMLRRAASAQSTLRIITGTGELEQLTAKPFSLFGSKHPNILLSVSYGNSEEMLRQVTEGLADIALIGTSGKYVEGFRATLVRRNRLCICCNRKNSLAQKKYLTMEDLRGQPMVGYSESHDLQRFYVDQCQKAGFEPTFSIFSTDPRIGSDMVERNASLCFGFADQMLKNDDPTYCVRTIPLQVEGAEEWGIYAITRARETRTVTQQLLIDTLLDADESVRSKASEIQKEG